MAEQNKIFPEGDLKQNRMYIENFDDFKGELIEVLGGEEFSTETLKAIYDKIVTGGATESNLNSKVSDIEGTNFVKDTHSLKSIKDTLTAIQGSGWSTENLKLIKELLDELKLFLPYRWQPSLVIDTVAPVQNVYYDALPVSQDVAVFQCYFSVADTGETVEFVIIADGRTFTGSQAAVAGTPYYVGINSGGTISFSTSVIRVGWNNISAPDEAHSYQIKFRKTTNAGSGTIRTVVDYKKRSIT